MARLPIRIRVTLAFAAAMAVLLVGLSAFLLLRLEAQLDQTIRQGLESRASDLAALTSSSSVPRRTALPEEDSSVAQLLDISGHVISAAPGSPATSLLSDQQLGAARRRVLHFTARLGEEPGPARLLAMRSGSSIIVVGQSLEARNEAVAQLRAQLLVGVPIALLLASLVGYVAAAAALRPVESMTRRARAIEAGVRGARLPVPPGDDEISRLGDTLNALLGRLEAALEHERAFVADASHELRAPLAIISAEIHVALRTASDVDAFRAALESLAVENGRVVRLAENLLVLARADQRRLPLRPETVDVGDFVIACAQRFSARAEEAGVRIEHDVAADLFAGADEVRFGQLLDNLAENALRYAASAVVLSAQRTRTTIVVRVSDDGPGFPADFVGRAFDRFAVADDARTGQQSGLGLAIVDAIARAHGWTVAVVSTTTPGAVVEVRLPALDPEHWSPLIEANDRPRARP
jgi:two-component system OmpR family sensor kinase